MLGLSSGQIMEDNRAKVFSETFIPLLTYLLTAWCRVLLEKLTGLQLIKKFPAFYGTRRFITALTRVRHLSLPWASPIQSTYPHSTSWRSILILSTHLHLGPFHQNLRINKSGYRAVKFFEKEEDEVARSRMQQTNEFQHRRYCIHYAINMTLTEFGRILN